MDGNKIQICPWSSPLEWTDVKNHVLSSDTSQFQKAYDIIAIWKERGSVPPYVDCTAAILQVLLYDSALAQSSTNLVTSGINDCNTKLLYSTAVVRFVNCIARLKNFEEMSMFSMAKELGIPELIISLRHDISHRETLPSLDILKSAVDFCFEWVKNNYWKMEMSTVLSSNRDLLNKKTKMEDLMHSALKMWRLLCNLTQLELDTVSKQQSDDLSSLFRQLYQECKECNCSQSPIIKNIKKYIDHVSPVNEDNHPILVYLKALERYFLMFLHHVSKYYIAKWSIRPVIMNIVNNGLLVEEPELPPQSWQPIIHYVHKKKSLDIMLEILFNNLTYENDVSTRAYNWILNLAPTVNYLRSTWDIYQSLLAKSRRCVSVSKKLQQAAMKQNRGKFKKIIKLKFRRPPVITSSVMRDVLRKPNRFTKNVLLSYYEAVEPPLSPDYVLNVCKLLDVYCHANVLTKVNNEADHVYTVDNLKEELRKRALDRTEDCDKDTEENNSLWQLYDDTDANVLKTVSIGLMPWQNQVDCELPPEVTSMFRLVAR